MGGGSTPVVGQQTMANSSPVVVASDQTAVPVSGTVAATQSGTWNVGLSVGSALIGHVITDTGSTTAITGNVTVVQGTGTNLHTVVDSGTITANAGTNLNTSALALEAGHIATLDANTPTLGQKTMSGSRPVTLASDQTAIPISGSVTATMVDTGATGAAVPGSAKYIGFNLGGLLTGISATSPLPTIATLDANTIGLLGTRYDQPQVTMLMSDPNGDFGDSVNLLELLMDSSQSIGIGTRVLNWPKQDVTGALLTSDAPGSIPFLSKDARTPLVVDTTGYATLVFQQDTAGIVTVTGSNDGVTYNAVVGFPINAVSTAPTAGVTAGASVYVVPVSTRYIKLTGPASTVTGSVYLRSTPASMLVAGLLQNINSVQFGGTAVVNAGVAGIPAVGGNIAVGVAPTANPILVAGVDTTTSATGVITNLTRRILVDTSGRTQAAAIFVDRAAAQLQGGVIAAPDLVLNAQVVTDQSRWNGMTLIELAGQILHENRITNQYLYNLARLIKRGEEEVTTPEDYRMEPDLFS